MLTRATCGILSDCAFIRDFDLRLLLALIREYELQTYKFVSCKVIAKNYRINGPKRKVAIKRVAGGLARLVAAGVLELGPRVYVHTGKNGDYDSGQKYKTYRLNPSFVLTPHRLHWRRKYYRNAERLMTISPLENRVRDLPAAVQADDVVP